MPRNCIAYRELRHLQQRVRTRWRPALALEGSPTVVGIATPDFSAPRFARAAARRVETPSDPVKLIDG